uniref:Uncharacterized protein n=1 Tax=Entomoneis paludosa TaxID=265537 RepID=A0A6U3AZZ2_9STRA|mmetsp:Transcript_27424/g.57429  ORF Transcript_27424/g.57429 Transcript_27424/m.57429 type:complete len:458 (+) Transcript_27424:123-1496(+)
MNRRHNGQGSASSNSNADGFSYGHNSMSIGGLHRSTPSEEATFHSDSMVQPRHPRFDSAAESWSLLTRDETIETLPRLSTEQLQNQPHLRFNDEETPIHRLRRFESSSFFMAPFEEEEEDNVFKIERNKNKKEKGNSVSNETKSTQIMSMMRDSQETKTLDDNISWISNDSTLKTSEEMAAMERLQRHQEQTLGRLGGGGRRAKAKQLAELYLQGASASQQEAFLQNCDKQDIAIAISLLEKLSKDPSPQQTTTKKPQHSKPPRRTGSSRVSSFCSEAFLEMEEDGTLATEMTADSSSSFSSASIYSSSTPIPSARNSRGSRKRQDSPFDMPWSCGAAIPEEENHDSDPLSSMKQCCHRIMIAAEQDGRTIKLSRKMKMQLLYFNEKMRGDQSNTSRSHSGAASRRRSTNDDRYYNGKDEGSNDSWSRGDGGDENDTYASSSMHRGGSSIRIPRFSV